MVHLNLLPLHCPTALANEDHIRTYFVRLNVRFLAVPLVVLPISASESLPIKFQYWLPKFVNNLDLLDSGHPCVNVMLYVLLQALPKYGIFF